MRASSLFCVLLLTGCGGKPTPVDSASETDADTDADADSDTDTDTDADTDCVVSEVQLTHLLAQTAPGTLPFPLTSLSPSTHFLLTEPVPLAADERLYFYADYNLAGYAFGDQFVFFAYALNSDYCALEAGSDLDSEPLLSVPVWDMTGAAPVEIAQSIRGGEGDWNTDIAVNIWDITEIDPIDVDCAATVRDSVDYTPQGQPIILLWQYGGWGVVVRDFRIYVGNEICQ